MKAVNGMLALALIAGPMAANAALVSGDGGEVVNDTTLNVTYANVVATGLNSAGAQVWISSLNAEDYAGYNNWQLPTADVTQTANGNGTGPSTSGTANQLSYLFLNELGNTSGTATTLGATGAAFNVTNAGSLPLGYSYTSLAGAITNNLGLLSGNTAPGGDVFFSLGGSQLCIGGGACYNTNADAVLAVRSGQATSPVPIPGTAWLLGSGFLGLMGISRLKPASALLV